MTFNSGSARIQILGDQKGEGTRKIFLGGGKVKNACEVMHKNCHFYAEIVKFFDTFEITLGENCGRGHKNCFFWGGGNSPMSPCGAAADL